MVPNTENFEKRIQEIFMVSEKMKLSFIDIVAGDLHTEMGGYPAPEGKHAMPSCCNAMKKFYIVEKDEILHEPPKGQGATLFIRYRLPR